MLASAACLALAVILALAGILKLRTPDALVVPLRSVLPERLVPRNPRVAAMIIGVGELAVAAALAAPRTPAPARWAAAAASAILCAGFVLFTYFARRNAVNCGCFGRLSLRPVGLVDIGRNVVLFGAAVLALADASTVSITLRSLAAAALFVAVFFTLTFIGFLRGGRPAPANAQAVAPPPPPRFLEPALSRRALTRRRLLSYAGMTVGGVIASGVLTTVRPSKALAANPGKLPPGQDELVVVSHTAQETQALSQRLQSLTWADEYLQSSHLVPAWDKVSSATGVAYFSWWSPTIQRPQLEMLVVPLQPQGFIAWSPDLGNGNGTGGGLATDGSTQLVWTGDQPQISASRCDVNGCAGEAIGVTATVIGGVACVVGCIDTLGLGCLVCGVVTAGGAASGALGSGACAACTASAYEMQSACVAVNSTRPYADNCCIDTNNPPCNVRLNACNCSLCCGCVDCPNSFSGYACIQLFNRTTGVDCGCGCCCFTSSSEPGP